MMALVLRACFAAQRRCYFGELRILRPSITCARHGETEDKRFVSAVQLKRYSTNEDKKFDESQPIYIGILNEQIKRLKIFSLSSSFCALLLQPMLFSKALDGDNMLALVGISGIFTVSAIGVPLLINMITRKYVTHIFYDPKEDKYSCRRYTLFLRVKEIQFTPEDVIIPDVNGMFQTCLIKKQPLFFDERHFTDVFHYSRIMGYDKPIDFKLDAFSTNVAETSSNVTKQKESGGL